MLTTLTKHAERTPSVKTPSRVNKRYAASEAVNYGSKPRGFALKLPFRQQECISMSVQRERDGAGLSRKRKRHERANGGPPIGAIDRSDGTKIGKRCPAPLFPPF
jgi:hypothetical protein